MPEHFYGIRHHGPGSARAVVAALTAQPPTILLVEGPPEADSLVQWVADSGLEPPVALLGYAVDDPGRAAFWPFAIFSPEWQAIRWARQNNIPVKFFDLPYAYRAATDQPPPPEADRPVGTERVPHPQPSPPLSAGPDHPASTDPGSHLTADAQPSSPLPAGPDHPAGAGPAAGSNLEPRLTADAQPAYLSPAEPAEVVERGVEVQGGGPPAIDQLAGTDPASRPARGGAGMTAGTGSPAAAEAPAEAETSAEAGPRAGGATPLDGKGPAGGKGPADANGPAEGSRAAEGRGRPVDPIGELAAAAGYDDPERWWEDVVEHRGLPAFEAIGEAMAAIRESAPADPEDLVREAYMRTVLREVRRGHEDIAVVCGAWHVPALTRKVAAKEDAALLKGRRKVKVAFTWVPWTYGRLANWSGYGAGVRSPGWYHHLFTTADEVIPRWLVDAARVLREEGVPTSSAHVIEATRLAEALAAVRGRPLAGLAEVTEAAEAVMCDGEPLRTELIGRRLVVGERLGAVPEEMPAVPLAQDLAARQRAVRLKPEALDRVLDLDLRKDTDLARSRLLHRLREIGVPWGEPDAGRRGTGTFREQWRLHWQPEFAIALIEGSMWGTTVVAAATAKVTAAARDAQTLGDVTKLVEVCLLADLTGAYPPVLAALDARAALDADLAHLMAAVPALARTLRYGDVRRTDVAGLQTVTTGLLARICAGLPAAVGGLSDEAAQEFRGHLDGVHSAVALLDDDELRERWLAAVESVARRSDVHGLLAGRLTRLLLDAGRLDDAEVRRRMRLPLTVGTPPAHAAAWVEGFLAGGGLLLVHDDALLGLLDDWLTDIPQNAFDDVLALLRRTFGGFAAGERRAIGERIAGGRPQQEAELELDHERAAATLPVLSVLLGHQVREGAAQ